VIDLVPNLRTAVFAPIFIPVAVRKDQKKEFIDRDRASAVGAVEFSGVQFLEMVCPLHSPSIRAADKVIWAVCH
jgi:hypothetical protein